MIRKNLLIFKLNLPEDSLQEQYSAFMRKFNPALEAPAKVTCVVGNSTKFSSSLSCFNTGNSVPPRLCCSRR